MKKKRKPSKIDELSAKMFTGLFLLFPTLFFGNYVKGTIWFHVFGVLALIGTVVVTKYFIKILREQKRIRKM